MKIHVLQHDKCEGLGAIADWIAERGHACTLTNVYKDQYFPHPSDIDWLIIMGGPMGTYEEDKFPWLVLEKKFIRSVVDANKIVLGICLGSQLLAEVLGGRVFRAKQKEIGWFPVELTAAAKELAFFKNHPQTFTPLHWHGDTFDLPPGAVSLAQSAATKNQAFQYGDRVLALQYHLEATEGEIKEFLDDCNWSLPAGQYIQNPKEIADARENFCASKELLLMQLKYLEDLAAK